MLVKEFIETANTHLANSDWDSVQAYFLETTQSFIDDKKLVQLGEFFNQLLHNVLTTDHAEKVISHVKNIKSFRDGFQSAYQEALEVASQDSKIKALYFECFYDGGDSSAGNIFLCTSYTDCSISWTSEFIQVIGNIPIDEYYSFDVDFDFSNQERIVASFYVAVRLLLACFEVQNTINNTLYPVAFADHDWGDFVLLSDSVR